SEAGYSERVGSSNRNCSGHFHFLARISASAGWLRPLGMRQRFRLRRRSETASLLHRQLSSLYPRFERFLSVWLPIAHSSEDPSRQRASGLQRGSWTVRSGGTPYVQAPAGIATGRWAQSDPGRASGISEAGPPIR